MSAYTPPCDHSRGVTCPRCSVPTESDYENGVADERARIAKALYRAASIEEDGGYSESSRHVLRYWARLVRDGELP